MDRYIHIELNRNVTGLTIRGHRPKSSVGDKILSFKEGDYKKCFREGEGNRIIGYGKDKGRKFPFFQFFHKNIEKSIFSLFFLKYPQNV